MTSKSIIYYGHDKQTYLDCLSMIQSSNRKHCLLISLWFLLVDALYLLFSSLNLFGATQEHLPFYAAYFLLALAFTLCVGLLPRFSERHSFFMVYCNMALLLSYGIIFSASRPYMPATMFLILLTVTALTYIDNMCRMFLVTALASGGFLLASYHFKTFSIAYNDTYNLVIVLTLVIGLHYTFQHTRVQQFILYQRDLQIQHELEITSSFDSLTGLLNRGRFFSITEKMLQQAPQGEYMALCLLDLDGFKQINDRLGHQMGDKVIQITGKTIMEAIGLREEDKPQVSQWDLRTSFSLAGRLGGDEFILLVRGKRGSEEVRPLLQRLLDTLNAVRFDGLDGIHASFGITELHSGERDMDSAYSRADAALYTSKRAGKNRIYFDGDTAPAAQASHGGATAAQGGSDNG